jgi:hypothetical protein
MTGIAVIDNASTWEPLLRYYETSGLTILNRTQNLGQDAFWKLGRAPGLAVLLARTPAKQVHEPAGQFAVWKLLLIQGLPRETANHEEDDRPAQDEND